MDGASFCESPRSGPIKQRLMLAVIALTLILGASLAGRVAPAAAACNPGYYWGGFGCVAAQPGFYADGGSEKEYPCSAGTYTPGSGYSSCVSASPGYYVPESGASEQKPCSPGSYSSGYGAASCTSAPPGTYAPSYGTSSPTECAPGTYQPNSGQTSCIQASPGQYVPGKGATSQTPCTAGSYQPNYGASSCIAAEPGHFVASTGATSQAACVSGTYQPSSGQTGCLIAQAGNYVPSSGQAAQTPCPTGRYQPNEGATSCFEAGAGNYVASTGQTAQTPCPVGRYQPATGQAACLAAGIGYYVSSAGSASETACPAGTTTAHTESTSSAQCVVPKKLHLRLGENGLDAANGSFYEMFSAEGLELSTSMSQEMNCGFTELVGTLVTNAAATVKASFNTFSDEQCHGNWALGAEASVSLYNALGSTFGSLSLSVKENTTTKQLPATFKSASTETYFKVQFASATCQYKVTSLKGSYSGPYPMEVRFVKQKLALTAAISTAGCPKSAYVTFNSTQYGETAAFEYFRL